MLSHLSCQGSRDFCGRVEGTLQSVVCDWLLRQVLRVAAGPAGGCRLLPMPLHLHPIQLTKQTHIDAPCMVPGAGHVQSLQREPPVPAIRPLPIGRVAPIQGHVWCCAKRHAPTAYLAAPLPLARTSNRLVAGSILVAGFPLWPPSAGRPCALLGLPQPQCRPTAAWGAAVPGTGPNETAQTFLSGFAKGARYLWPCNEAEPTLSQLRAGAAPASGPIATNCFYKAFAHSLLLLGGGSRWCRPLGAPRHFQKTRSPEVGLLMCHLCF